MACNDLIEDDDDPAEFGPEIPFGPHEQIIGTARIRREEDAETPHWQLSGKCAVAGEIAVTTILYQDKSDEEWAIATWRSLLVQPSDDDDNDDDDNDDE